MLQTMRGRALRCGLLGVASVPLLITGCSSTASTPTAAGTTAPSVAAAPAESVAATPSSQASASATCTDAADDGSVLALGAPLGISGVIADQAKQMQWGYEMYLNEHDQKLGGLTTKILIEDSQSDPNTVVQKTRKLIQNDQVDAIVGGALAFESLAIKDQVEAANMAYVSPISSADDLTQRKASPLIARTNMTSSQLNMPFGAYAHDVLGYNNIAIVAQDYAYGWESAGGFQYGFEKAGGKVAKKIWVPLGAPDWAPYVRQIPEGVDAVYALPIGPGVLQFVKAYDDYGLLGKVPLIGGPDLADEDALKALGESADGIISVHNYNPMNEQTKKFASDFEAAYGEVPSYWGESTYTELMWIDRALASYRARTCASGADTVAWVKGKPEEFIAEMQSVQLPDAPRGPLSLDAYNNGVMNGYVKETKLDGAGKPYSDTVATFENVSQFWDVPADEFLAQPVFSRDFPQ